MDVSNVNITLYSNKKVLKTKIILSYSFNLVITIFRKYSLTF